MNTNRLIRGLVGDFTKLDGTFHPADPCVVPPTPVSPNEDKLRSLLLGTVDGPCALQALMLNLAEHRELYQVVEEKRAWRVAYLGGPSEVVMELGIVPGLPKPSWGVPVGAPRLTITRTAAGCVLAQGGRTCVGSWEQGPRQVRIGSPVFSFNFQTLLGADLSVLTLEGAWASYPFAAVAARLRSDAALVLLIHDVAREMVSACDDRRVVAAASLTLAKLTLVRLAY